GNTFEVTYRRPLKSRPADVPVISYVVDVSESMDNPLPGGQGYRNDKVAQLLHDFVLDLPDTVLGQVISFDGAVYFNQVMTDRKADLLRSISMLDGKSSGTDILGAVDAALKAQAAVPSSRRTMVFITDAALDVPAGERKKFETLLGRLKDENIRCLWIGIGSDLGEEGFKRAAAKTGGRYVITEDSAALTTAFTDLTAEIRNTAE
ncbi:MAG: VWA domain-containing protein, partial [Desulfobacterales bacterium]|nr:VWA domain-containing protein [Desulfobacterales bacterium]